MVKGKVWFYTIGATLPRGQEGSARGNSVTLRYVIYVAVRAYIRRRCHGRRHTPAACCARHEKRRTRCAAGCGIDAVNTPRYARAVLPPYVMSARKVVYASHTASYGEMNIVIRRAINGDGCREDARTKNARRERRRYLVHATRATRTVASGRACEAVAAVCVGGPCYAPRCCRCTSCGHTGTRCCVRLRHAPRHAFEFASAVYIRNARRQWEVAARGAVGCYKAQRGVASRVHAMRARATGVITRRRCCRMAGTGGRAVRRLRNERKCYRRRSRRCQYAAAAMAGKRARRNSSSSRAYYCFARRSGTR